MTRSVFSAIAGLVGLALWCAALGGGGLGGCSRDATPPVQPASPGDPPPLPPGSGTPIGYLLDEPGLALTGDQRTQLKAIDDDLARKLTYLDGIERNAGSGNPSPEDDTRRGDVGFSASGARSGQDLGKITGQEGGNSALHTKLPPGTAADNAATVQRVPEVRAHDVRTAIARAMALLDPGQQKLARQVLVDRGVDPDTGKFQASGQPGSARQPSAKP